jgi:hypothetical protein
VPRKGLAHGHSFVSLSRFNMKERASPPVPSKGCPNKPFGGTGEAAAKLQAN